MSTLLTQLSESVMLQRMKKDMERENFRFQIEDVTRELNEAADELALDLKRLAYLPDSIKNTLLGRFCRAAHAFKAELLLINEDVIAAGEKAAKEDL